MVVFLVYSSAMITIFVINGFLVLKVAHTGLIPLEEQLDLQIQMVDQHQGFLEHV